MISIGPYRLRNRLALAPMAGVTDRPFRQLARQMGAGLVVGEMVSANPRLLDTDKTRRRLDHRGEPSPRAVQIAGGDPETMAAAARLNVEQGAEIIDINMGCPAKKVCRKAAGSALLADEGLVADILATVVAAVDVPVTLKMRTGVSAQRRNGVTIARLAEEAGIAALAVHGRTRDQHYRGVAEYDTIRAIKQAVDIPLWANGDIGTVAQARQVLAATGADGLMIGRAVCRRPWLFRELHAALGTGGAVPPPTRDEEAVLLLGLVEQIHDFYGEAKGVRIARKHVDWLCERRPPHPALRWDLMQADSAARQLRLLETHFRVTPEPVTQPMPVAAAA